MYNDEHQAARCAGQSAFGRFFVQTVRFEQLRKVGPCFAGGLQHLGIVVIHLVLGSEHLFVMTFEAADARVACTSVRPRPIKV